MPIFTRIILLFLIFSSSSYAIAQSAAIPGEVVPVSADVSDTVPVMLLIGDITITGNKLTKDYIILREVVFKQGDHVLQSELPARLELCRQQLMNTTLFVEVELKPTIVSEVALIEVIVKERWYLFPLPYFKIIGRNFNDWWVEHNRSLDRINYGLKFTQNNFSGRNDNLNFWLVSGYTQQASIRYESPYIDNTLKHGMSIGLSYSRNRELNYADSMNKQVFTPVPDAFIYKTIHFDIGYSYRPAIKTRHNFSVQYNDIEVDKSVLELNPNYFPNSRTRIRYPAFSYSIHHFNVDYIPYPLKGFMGDAYLFTRFSNDFMTQVGYRGTYTKEVFKRSYLQLQAAGSIKVPFTQAYYSSGMFGSSDFYMRGLEPYVIQGVVGLLGRTTVIKQAAAFNIRNPIKIKGHEKIPFRFMVKAYGDVGYAHFPNPATSRLNNKLLRTWGAGVDILSIYDMVLKIEYSFNQLGGQGVFIHTAADF